ncbi:PepSY domain-containing protein [Sinorhizobium fredii]|nr:PepSY domain-containing protein [Sinorhizobium fredii]AWI59573.1 hypothetical protein AB395_00003947 [Sinorhizobium fredii CCBAU 45436]
MLDEFFALGIWTGWAFAILIPLALTSNDWSQRLLLSRWKQRQRLVYAAAALAVFHWIFVHNSAAAALVHFLPLVALEAYRIWRLSPGGKMRMRPLEAQMKREGWSVRRIKEDGGCYEAYDTTPEGQRVEAYFHPVTLEKLLVSRRGEILFRKEN